MASGFITLSNGEDWSARWSRYDFVLEQIANELNDEADEKILKDWLMYLQPNEEGGDIECSWSFIKANDDETVLRILDIRRMKDHYQRIFWKAAELAAHKHSPDSDTGYCINELFKAHSESLKQPSQPPSVDDKETLDCIFFIGGFEIGKFEPEQKG
jgi:hypothetical protein